MYKTWNTPGGTISRLYNSLLSYPHVLIAGATGSGKSTVINGMLHALLVDKTPADAQLILIDPKLVELAEYEDLPHTITHASGFNPGAWLTALNQACAIMDSRYQAMRRARVKLYPGGDLYVIIDEYAMIAKSGGRDCVNAVLRLTSEGRAAKVHVIAATQVPKATIIPTEIRENFTARVCLRCNTPAQSRVLMDMPGCDKLPQYGYGYVVTPADTKLYQLTRIDDAEITRVADYWQQQSKSRFKIV